MRILAKVVSRGLSALAGMALLAGATVAEETLRFYVDADYSVTGDVAEAIDLGVRTALHQRGNRLAGITFEVVPMDHRGSPRRSFANMKRFQADPQALAVFGGMQSPPYLTYGDQLNAWGVPLLLTWSAGAPVTRMAAGDGNFVFRLSIDDSKAGPFLVRQALARGCRAPAVLLGDTGWGRSNKATILPALAEADVNPSVVKLIPDGLGQAEARSIAQQVEEAQADCAIFVGTSGLGDTLLPALATVEGGLRVISHWGILSSDFETQVTHAVRQSLDLSILQSCALEREQAGNTMLIAAKTAAQALGADFDRLGEQRAYAGFIHAYDMVQIVAAALEQAMETPAWTEGPLARRRALKEALETLERPVVGILQTYARPFRPFSAADNDAHEALSGNDLCLARFSEEGFLTLSDVQG